MFIIKQEANQDEQETCSKEHIVCNADDGYGDGNDAIVRVCGGNKSSGCRKVY